MHCPGGCNAVELCLCPQPWQPQIHLQYCKFSNLTHFAESLSAFFLKRNAELVGMFWINTNLTSWGFDQFFVVCLFFPKCTAVS